jgi:hypothetical protein
MKKEARTLLVNKMRMFASAAYTKKSGTSWMRLVVLQKHSGS